MINAIRNSGVHNVAFKRATISEDRYTKGYIRNLNDRQMASFTKAVQSLDTASEFNDFDINLSIRPATTNEAQQRRLKKSEYVVAAELVRKDNNFKYNYTEVAGAPSEKPKATKALDTIGKYLASLAKEIQSGQSKKERIDGFFEKYGDGNSANA